MIQVLSGRQKALELLQEKWLHAVGGSGRNLLVTGVAGIGKTHLVRHFLDSLEADDVEILRGTAYLPHDNLLYAPIIEAFGTFLQSKSKEQRSVLITGLHDLKHLFPDLETDGSTIVHDHTLQKIRLFQCFAKLLSRLAQQKAVILFLDDLHWADVVSTELFHYLATVSSRHPLLLIATFRSEGLEQDALFRKTVNSLSRIPHTEQFTVQPFEKQEIAEFFQKRVGGLASVTLLKRLTHQTGGSPLFLSALLDALQTEGLLFLNGLSWDLQKGEIPLPPTIRELVLERLERFSVEEQALLRWLVVCPDGLSHALLSEVAEQTEDCVLKSIQGICVPGFLGESVQHGKTFYKWSHPLVRQVIYTEIPRATRHQLHARLAEVIEQELPDDVYHLANHYCVMDVDSIHPKAVQTLQRAGEEAKILGAHHEAVKFFLTALGAVRCGTNKEQLSLLLEYLGEVKNLQGERKEALILLEEALAKYEQLEDWPGVARIRLHLANIQWARLAFEQAHWQLKEGLSVLEGMEACPEWERLQATRLVFLDRCHDFEPLRELLQEIEVLSNGSNRSLDFRIAVGLCELGFDMREGRYAEAQQKIAEILPLAQDTQDFAQIVRVQNFAGLLAHALGNHTVTEEHFLANLSFIKEHSLVGAEPSVLGLGGMSRLMSGHWEEALQRTLQGIHLAEQVNSTRYHARLHALCTLILSSQGKFDDAKSYLQKAYSILGGRTDDLHITTTIWLTEAVYFVESEQYESALDILQKIPSETESITVDGILTTYCITTWGHALLGAGRITKLQTVIEMLRQRGKDSEYCATWADYFYARQLLLEETCEEAQNTLLKVAQSFARLRIPLAEAKAWLAWFQYQTPQRSSRQNFEWLRRAERMLELFQNLQAEHRIEQAWNILAPHGITKATLSDQHRYLSKRECEIAELIAKGFKNNEIAKSLHISPHTVNSHLKRMYTKLNINSRAELVHFVFEHQLVSPKIRQP